MLTSTRVRNLCEVDDEIIIPLVCVLLSYSIDSNSQLLKKRKDADIRNLFYLDYVLSKFEY